MPENKLIYGVGLGINLVLKMEGKWAVFFLEPQPTRVAAVSCSLGRRVAESPGSTAGQKPCYVCHRAGLPLPLGYPDSEVS